MTARPQTPHTQIPGPKPPGSSQSTHPRPNLIAPMVSMALSAVDNTIMATVNTLAGDLYRLEERGRVQGWLSSVWGISAVFGPTLGGSLAQYASWRWIFVINLPLGAAAIVMIARYLHERVSRTRHRIDA